MILGNWVFSSMCNKQQSGANAWRQSPIQLLASQTKVELCQEKLEQQLGAVCPSLAFQLFTWRDNALKIAIRCRLRHHFAPDAVSFSLLSKAGRRLGEEGITFFSLFWKSTYNGKGVTLRKHKEPCGSPSLTSNNCSGIDFLLPATALSPKAELHDRWNEWVGRNEESCTGGMSMHASGQPFKCKAIRWDYFQHREPWEKHPLVTAQHRHLSFLPHPGPGTIYHVFHCLQHGASQGRPKTEVSRMMELLVSQKGSMKQQSNIQVLCRPQCTTDLSNMFQKRQTRAIPELVHVVVPLTRSLALYLCNLLSLPSDSWNAFNTASICVVFKQTSFAALQD